MSDPDLDLDGESFDFATMVGTDGRGFSKNADDVGGKPTESKWNRMWRNLLITLGIAESAYALQNLVGTSTSTVSVGTGSKSFTTQTNLGFKQGMRIVTAKVGDAVNTRMEGSVFTYDSTTGALVQTADIASGSGSASSWHIYPKQGAMDGPSSAVDYATAAANGTTGKLLRFISSWAFDSSSNYNANDKTLSQVVLKDSAELSQPVTAASTTTIDIQSGNVVYLSHGASITTLNINNPSASGNACVLTIIRDKDNSGTTRTITWPASIDWGEDGEPILIQTTNARGIFQFITNDGGTSWLGFAKQGYVAP